ncbi:hypothetical protein G9A89_003089 [Geosiphon pyriformis]|nr:hypothetical protein G9A89_003089 [Geosiphon pyriformis]
MTDFGLSDEYVVHDGLDQGEKIFYDPLLCEIKRQEHLCKYRIISNFVAKSGRVESSSGKFFFFAAGAFVNDTIWVGNGQALTQHILDIASKFFEINNISINNDKTVVILINPRVVNASLLISDRPIFIAKGDESHRYLGIFLSTEGLFKPSFAKTHADVRFFFNMVFRKAISNKQFFYLVSAVLQPIICYHTQFSFVTKRVCQRSKALLPKDFPNKALHHPSLYSLKSFEQVQIESKIALVIGFSNASGILGYLFVHHALDLQVLGWAPLYLLSHPVKLRVCPLNNFLTGVVRIFIDTNIFLFNHISCAFHGTNYFPMSRILGADDYFDVMHSLKHFGIAFRNILITKCGRKRLSPKGPVPSWFTRAFVHVNGFLASFEVSEARASCSEFFCSDDYLCIRECLHEVWTRELNVYTDNLLNGLGTGKVTCRAAAFFSEVGMSVGVKIQGLLSSTLAELQAIALVLECVPLSCSVVLYSDSQVALDACVLESKLCQSDFHNHCWMERCHISNLIRSKDILVRWIKMKEHSGIMDNNHANAFACAVAHFDLAFPVGVSNRFLMADGFAISGNAKHFVLNVLDSSDIRCIDWEYTTSVWHPDSHMLADFTSKNSAALCTYLMKTVHRRLPVAVQKKLYDKCYLSVLCLMCGEVEFSDHAFTCFTDLVVYSEVISGHVNLWKFLVGDHLLVSSSVLLTLAEVLDSNVYMKLCKGFVFVDWIREAVAVFGDKKSAIPIVINFVCYLTESYYSKTWLLRSKFKINMEKSGLICDLGEFFVPLHGLFSLLSEDVVCMLSIIESFAVSFGFRNWYLFFSRLDNGDGILVSI